jgi:hypothetical protein
LADTLDAIYDFCLIQPDGKLELARVGKRIQVAENKNFQKSKSEIKDVNSSK